MAVKGLFALVVAALIVAGTAVVFSLDSLAASRDDGTVETEQTAAQAQAHGNHNVALPTELRGQVPGERRRAGEIAQGLRREAAGLQPGNLAKVEMTLKDIVVEIAPGAEVQDLGLRRPRRPGPIVHVREGRRSR